MSLGTNIQQLRMKAGMSQSQLADALDVSRQSVSKWETDAAVPDLDKLVKLSALFSVSLDRLVTGADSDTERSAPQPTIIVEQKSPVPTRIIVGCILFAAALVLFLVFALSSGFLTALLLCLPFAAGGTACFIKRRGVLTAFGWVFYALLDVFLLYCTSLHWRTCLSMRDPLRLVSAGVQFLIMGTLVLFTSKLMTERSKRSLILVLAASLLFLLLPFRPHSDFLWILLRLGRDLSLLLAAVCALSIARRDTLS